MVHHGDLLGKRQRFDLIMGDEQGRDADPLDQRRKLPPHGVAQAGIEIRQRLVEQKQARIAHDRARERHALLLAAGQPRRRAACHRLHADDREHIRDPLRDLVLAQARALDAQRIGDVFKHVEMRPDRIGLEHHADRAFMHRHEDAGCGIGHDAPADLDSAALGLFEAGNAAQCGGFSATAWTEQRVTLRIRDFEADVIDGRHRAIGRAQTTSRAR